GHIVSERDPNNYLLSQCETGLCLRVLNRLCLAVAGHPTLSILKSEILPEALDPAKGLIGHVRPLTGGRRLHNGEASIHENAKVELPCDNGTPCPECKRCINVLRGPVCRHSRDRA